MQALCSGRVHNLTMATWADGDAIVGDVVVCAVCSAVPQVIINEFKLATGTAARCQAGGICLRPALGQLIACNYWPRGSRTTSAA